MKFICDVEKGDVIDITYPNGVSVSETVIDVTIGEDGYKGSGRWYKYIHTANESNAVSPNSMFEDDMPTHWPIMIMFFMSMKSYEAKVQVAKNIYAKIHVR
jgi:hypothetical protein